MKRIVRTALFTAASIFASQYLIKGFDFGEDLWRNAGLITFAVCVLYIFIKPLLAIISLPNRGIMFFFISFLTTGILFYILTIVLVDFAFVETTLPGLTLFGRILPEKELVPLLSLVFSALVVSFTHLFLEGLCCDKK